MPFNPYPVLKKYFAIGFVCKNFLPWALLFLIGYLVFEKTEDLSTVTKNNKNLSVSIEKKEITHKPTDKYIEKAVESSAGKNDEEWCEPLPYSDLSNHQSIVDFKKWLVHFEGFEKFDHQNCMDCGTQNELFNDNSKNEFIKRIRSNLILKGEKLAKERAKTFIKIIKGDPEKAIEIAVQQSQQDMLPVSVSEHLEKWVSSNADISTVHLCGKEGTSNGQFRRFAKLPNNKTIEAYFYGKRNYLKSTKQLAVWGVTMQDVAAFSDQPLRIIPQIQNDKTFFSVSLGEIELKINSVKGLNALAKRVNQSEKLAKRTGIVRYPVVAGSDGTVSLIDARYSVSNAVATWGQAQKVAFDNNKTLVNIESSEENKIVFNLLRDAEAIGLLPENESNTTTIQYAWIGATDANGSFGSFYDNDLDQFNYFPINSSEGNWFWQNGNQVTNATYTNWKDGIIPDSNSLSLGSQDYAAIDFNYTVASDSYWIDLNQSYRLPFVLEDANTSEVRAVAATNGKRKVLIVPSRFQDETNDFDGSSSNPTDQFGNPLNANNGSDTFHPDTLENIIGQMEDVKDFFLKNSDGTFELEYVITPTITMRLDKFRNYNGSADGTRWNYQPSYLFWFQEDLIGFEDDYPMIKGLVGQQYPEYDYFGPVFEGVLSVEVVNAPGPFTSPPELTFHGGGIPNEPRFVPAEGRAVLDEDGYVSEIIIDELGAYYQSTPAIKLDGVEYDNNYLSITIGRTVVSWVIINSYDLGSPGVGYVGQPGSHVMVPTSGGTVAHELGHNLGLWHARRHEGEGIRPNSDDGTSIDYGNDHSIMGGGGINGDFTISSKVLLNEYGHFGYVGGNIVDPAQFNLSKVDVADLRSFSEVENSLLKEQNATNSNTFRVYRHDYGSAPYALRVREFELDIPSSSIPSNFNSIFYDLNQSVHIGGPGDGAKGYVSVGGVFGYKLTIINSGKGYSEEPRISILDDNNVSVLDIDPAWIKIKSGTENYASTSVRNLSPVGFRGLRGLELPASQFSPLSPEMRMVYDSYWVSYRRQASEYGLCIINANSRLSGASENVLLDMSQSTQLSGQSVLINRGMTPGDDFDDAMLMLGRTFSDYESDTHITPVIKGGTDPMEYIDVVVNVGTVGLGLARAPKFELNASNLNPFVNERVYISADPVDKNDSYSNYAYAWYLNENALNAKEYLNRRTISLDFPQSGYQVVKVIISDMKGGVSSQNVVFNVSESELENKSYITGQVTSPRGNIQGAKVVISKANVIEHNVRVNGKIEDSRIHTTHGNPLSYSLDSNERGQKIEMHRGEIHRFIFEPSTHHYPLTFFESPHSETAKIRLNLLFNPYVEHKGGGYNSNPSIDFNETSIFDNYYSSELTTIDLFQQKNINGVSYHNLGTLISKPSAKSILDETTVTRIIVRPVSFDPITGMPINYGGRDMDRENPPGLQILRSSYWEDYNDTNATATPYIDGVGTIILDDYGSGYPAQPDVVIFGAGNDANYTALLRDRNKTDDNWRSSSLVGHLQITDQGHGFDPNSTKAVVLYPTDPYAYWSFDEDESLYETGDKNNSATPAFNLANEQGLVAYWKFDEENATTFSGDFFIIEDNSSTESGGRFIPNGNDLNVSGSGANSLVSARRSYWGTKNRSLLFNSDDEFQPVATNTLSLDNNFSVSIWLQPIDIPFNAQFTVRGLNLNIDQTSSELATPNALIDGSISTDLWSHVGIIYQVGSVEFFINGDSVGTESYTPINTSFSFLSGFNNVLMDEVKIYNRALSVSEMMELAGNIYLDLSGNKLHAVARGTGFEMNAPSDAGTVTNTFTTDTLGKTQLGNAVSIGGDRYLDLSHHISELGALDGGAISFWIKPSSGPILSISNTKKYNFCKISVDTTKVIKYEAYNFDEVLVDLKTKGGSNALKSSDWSHVVINILDSGISVRINDKDIPILRAPNTENARVFAIDIDQADYFAIGRHEDNVTTNGEFFNGQLDEFHIFERELTPAEITYLYNVGKKARVLRARLNPKVDAVGSVIMNNHGEGFKEVPDVDFNVSFYRNNPSYPNFEAPVGVAELNATSVESVLLTKKLDFGVELILPEGRVVVRDEVEYVKVQPNASGKADPPIGLFGYSSPPKITTEGSHNAPIDFNASVYPLFFIDPNNSSEIVNPGKGYDLNSNNLSHSFMDDANKTYEIIKINLSWIDAVDYAVQRGGKLAEINSTEENDLIFNGILASGINFDNTRADDGGAGAYVWLGGNDIANEGNWTWDGRNEGNGKQFWDGDLFGNGVNNYFLNWGSNFGFQNEPDDFAGSQDALAISLDGWPFGERGQWNDLNQNNPLYFVIEYNGTVNLPNLAVGFDTDAVRIFGPGYRPPNFEAKINQGRVDSVVMKDHGEGYYDANPSDSEIYFLGEGTRPTIVSQQPGVFYYNELTGYRINTNPEYNKNPTDGNYDVITGIKLHDKPDQRGKNWITPPTVFADWGDQTWEGHVGVSNVEFNYSISNIKIEDRGFGYLAPVEISVIDGKPSIDPTYKTLGGNRSHPFHQLDANFSKAIIRISEINEAGTILELNITDGGSGYEPTINMPPYDLFAIGLPQIFVNGGGGVGAEIYAFVDANGSIYDYLIVDGGIGYYNIDSNNTPKAVLSTADGRSLGSSEKQAELHVSLGGSLKAPTENNTGGNSSFKWGGGAWGYTGESFDEFMFAAPWVMILDKGRPESNVTKKAHAVAKVVDGNITKIIVTDGGEDYIDPHIIICGTPPNYDNLHESPNVWKWRCNNLRETEDGKFLRCEHVHAGMYPPENCPGESGINAFRTDAKWDDNFTDWNEGHSRSHKDCPADSNHRQNIFYSPVCSGTKANYVLINDYYRGGADSYEEWVNFETNCSAVVEDGKIREIKIDQYGSKYLAPEIVLEGSGSGTDPVPIFNEQGIITEIFYDDPRILNTKIDLIDNPIGAGQGFYPKPWGKDLKYQPTFGASDATRCHIYADVLFYDGWTGPELEVYDFSLTLSRGIEIKHSYSDRVAEIQIFDSGNYAAGDFNITVDYNSSYIPDLDLNGTEDFIAASARVETTAILSKFQLDSNGTFEESSLTLQNGDVSTVQRGTFIAEPDVTIFNEFNGVTFSNFINDSPSGNIRVNGQATYDPIENQSYFDLVVDDQLPNNLYYGFAGSDHKVLGGEIQIFDGMPAYNWGSENDWDDIAFTDEFGNYIIPNLEPGLYNIAVLMEDENFQDLALRPNSDYTLSSRTIYVPGFDPITLETDNLGKGRSRLIWSIEAQKSSKFSSNPQKILEGVGGGFKFGDVIELTIKSHGSNTTLAVPKIQTDVLSDGTLSLSIIDDENTSIFDPDDRFLVSYSGVISGIDFTNKFSEGFIDHSFFGGNKGSIDSFTENNDSYVLTLSPNSGALINSVEVPIANESDPDAFTTFTLNAYDSNGSRIDCSSAKWTLEFIDFEMPDTNHSKRAVLQSPQYYIHGNGGLGNGYYYPLFMNSVYRDLNGSGIYNPIDFTAEADHSHTFDGRIYYMELGNPNNSHAQPNFPINLGLIEGPADGNLTNQVNLILYSTLHGGRIKLSATLHGQTISTYISASPKSVSRLTDFEQWIDHYFSTVLVNTVSTLDEDNDSLTLSDEFLHLTNPLSSDTDLDGLTDDDEINNIGYPTNPRNSDSDGDGFIDSTELIPELLSIGFHPLIFNQTPPYPTIHPHNVNGVAISVTPGEKVIIGAEANETSLTGDKIALTVSLDGNFTQVLTQSGEDWVVNQDAMPGVYFVTYSALDSLKRKVELVHKIIVEEIDVTPPSIELTSGGSPIIDNDGNLTAYLLIGEAFLEPAILAFDQKDGVLTDNVQVSGLNEIDYNNTGTYVVKYSVQDEANNSKVLDINVIVQEPAFVITGKAIDGYLSGSTVIFDSIADGNFDGQHDLNRTILTDATGSFSLMLTTAELHIFGGENNSLEPHEAKIIVSGGYDPTIESNFTGRYEADINSSIVSPLTTLVSSLMNLDENLTKEEAKTKVQTAFGLDVDPTNFDPLANALDGNESARNVLLATTRLANVMKQVDAMVINLSIGTTEVGQASNLFVENLAQSIATTDSNPLDDTTTITNALNSALTKIQTDADISGTANAVTIFQSSDNAIMDTATTSTSLTDLAKGLAKNQQAIEEAIIFKYTDPIVQNISDIAASVSTDQIKGLSELVTGINVFPPVANDFNASINVDNWTAGALTSQISATDGDGDSLDFTIISSNFDKDADGTLPFSISSTGELKIEDTDDLIHMAGQTIKLKLSVSDGKGMVANVIGTINLDNKLSLTGTPLANKPGWTYSWFGNTFSNGGSWIYHPSHEWLNVNPDNDDGYWFWDAKMNIWWWTKSSIYPYFYRANYGWNYWKFNESLRIYFDYPLNDWQTP